jgi:hypothetical protein
MTRFAKLTVVLCANVEWQVASMQVETVEWLKSIAAAAPVIVVVVIFPAIGKELVLVVEKALVQVVSVACSDENKIN